MRERAGREVEKEGKKSCERWKKERKRHENCGRKGAEEEMKGVRK